MYLYNSATHKKEEFKTHTPGHVEMYTCGPTVYHFAHIGNLRSYIMEDVLEKYLRYAGYDVNRVMNITDVGHLTSDADEGEDKMLKGAKREHKTVMEIAQYYTDAFFSDCRKLNIKRPDVVQPATGLIDDYIKIITRLMDTGYAYFAGGNVYFDTSKLQRYYIFNDHNEEDLAVGVREGVEEDPNKRNKNDFVLWFTKSKFEDQALKWDSPWGVGYPGWHIECSGISMKFNGEYLDLHCGGVDNAFPHHTNEIAQSESYLGHPWCPHWCHVAHLNTDHGKMSKSKGEFLTVSLLEEKGYDPLAYRFFCLQSHYRKSLVFTWENLDNATVAYNKLLARIAARRRSVNIAIVGKYTRLHDAYLSVMESLYHAGYETGAVVHIKWVEAEEVNPYTADDILRECDGILVPGGFGDRGIEGMVHAAHYARTQGKPYFGICLGMQIAVIEYARSMLGYADANSSEFDPVGAHSVIDLMPDQKALDEKGGTMRLGRYPCVIMPGTRMAQAYGAEEVSERHRHRYEFNNEYRTALREAGLVLAGTSPDGRLVEAVEVPGKRFYVGVQYHPEFKSRPNRAHPLFRAFVADALRYQDEDK